MLVLNVGVSAGRAAAPFFKPNDVVAFVGSEDAAAAAEFGQLELRLTRAWPDYRIKFRSLAWEGDMVFQQVRELNYPALEQQLDDAGATVVIAQFGQIESMAGDARVSDFVAAYETLIAQLSGGGKRKVVLKNGHGSTQKNGVSDRNGSAAKNGIVATNGAGAKNGIVLVADKSLLVDKSKYRPSDKEPFMSERQREYFRIKLLGWREDILKEAKETLQHLQDENQNHPDLADRASSETDRAIELRARDRQRKLIAKIDAHKII